MTPQILGASLEERLALAQCIASNAIGHYLTPENDRDGCDDLAYVISTQRPYYVDVTDDVLALDFDATPVKRGGPPRSGESARQDIEARLDIYGYPRVVVTSGGPGRHHLFIRIPAGPFREQLEALARRVGYDVRRQIRPPLTPHRQGREVRLRDPHSAAEAVQALSSGPARPPFGREADALWWDWDEHHSGDRSAIIQSLATAAVNAGWTFSDFLEVLSDPTHDPGQYMRAHRTHRGHVDEVWLRRSWDKAEAFVADNPARRRDPIIARLTLQARSRAWTGRTGATDRAVYLGFLSKAAVAGRTTFNCSTRELTEHSGMGSKNTVLKAITRLEQQGLISRVTDGTLRGRSSTWGLGDVSDPCLLTPQLQEIHGSDVRTDQDLFRNGGGLGKSLEALHDLLQISPMSISEAATLTGKSARTTRSHFKRLVAFGLAAFDDDGRLVPASGVDITALERELGVAGKGERQKEAHRREREHFERIRREHERQSIWPGMEDFRFSRRSA